MLVELAAEVLELNRLFPPPVLLFDENKLVDDFIGDVLFCVLVENKLFEDDDGAVWNKLLELLAELNAEDDDVDDELVAFENRPPPPVFVLEFEFVNKLPPVLDEGLLKSVLDWGLFENNPAGVVDDDVFELPWLLNRSKRCLIINGLT